MSGFRGEVGVGVVGAIVARRWAWVGLSRRDFKDGEQRVALYIRRGKSRTLEEKDSFFSDVSPIRDKEGEGGVRGPI